MSYATKDRGAEFTVAPHPAETPSPCLPGVLNADIIRAGVLEDYDKNFSLDFATGKLTMKKGSINIGDNFIVDEEGNLTAQRGTFYGSLVGVIGIEVKDENGNTVMTIDAKNGITIQKGSIKWSGISGKPSIPTLPGYIQGTHIDATKVESFHIMGNKIEVVCPRVSYDDPNAGFILTGEFNNKSEQYLRFCCFDADVIPQVIVNSPLKAVLQWNVPNTVFLQNVDFRMAKVTGLHLTLA